MKMEIKKLSKGEYVYKFGKNVYDVEKISAKRWKLSQNGATVEFFDKKSDAVSVLKKLK